MIDLVSRWRGLERTLRDKGLGWGLRYAPAQLRHARSAEHPYGAELDHLLPADYRAFLAEVGYPVIGFRYYDRDGLSFLPVEAMAAISVNLPDAGDEWPEPVDGAPTRCLHAFFAGFDLSDIEGYSFGPANDGGEPVVWRVERGGPVEECGTFTEWLHDEISRQEVRVAGLGATAVAELERENEGEDDPHRLLDYSLGGSYDQAPYPPEDLELAWVESQDGMPYSYGLVDGTGAWLIPLGNRFRSVRPFRGGVAEVILNVEDSTYAGPWTTIRPDGSIVVA